jgi:hypothetical protein
MDPRVRELVMLSALAALGCGLAAVRGDLLFVATFGVATVVTIIEAYDVCSETKQGLLPAASDEAVRAGRNSTKRGT